METDLAEFHSRNTELLAIAVQDHAGAQTSVSQTGATYPILADADHQVAEAYGVYNLLDDGVAAPAAFIIDSSGRIFWAYVGQNIRDRPSNQLILENLPSL